MTMTSALFIFLVLAIGTALLAGIWRYFACRYQWVDIPNARSAHTRPVPRGGGIAIAAVWFGILFFAHQQSEISASLFWALIGGGLPIMLVSYWDDRYSVRASIRLVIHIISASVAVWILQGMPDSFHPVLMFSMAIKVVLVVWLTNLYNFMDGIDGLAAGQSVLTASVAAILCALQGALDLAFLFGSLSAVSLGFLVWNWSPAKMFMGDVASALLGFNFAVMALASIHAHALTFSIWYLLLAVFIMDTTLTLLRRILRGERWYEAHSTHAYQHLVKKIKSHAYVTAAILAIGGVTAGLAVFILYRPIFAEPVVVATIMLLFLGWRRAQQ